MYFEHHRHMPCRRCSNYIFIPDLTHGFNGLGKENCKTGRETSVFWDLTRLIAGVGRYFIMLITCPVGAFVNFLHIPLNLYGPESDSHMFNICSYPRPWVWNVKRLYFTCHLHHLWDIYILIYDCCRHALLGAIDLSSVRHMLVHCSKLCRKPLCKKHLICISHSNTILDISSALHLFHRCRLFWFLTCFGLYIWLSHPGPVTHMCECTG